MNAVKVERAALVARSLVPCSVDNPRWVRIRAITTGSSKAALDLLERLADAEVTGPR
jgi:hypothetical protein